MWPTSIERRLYDQTCIWALCINGGMYRRLTGVYYPASIHSNTVSDGGWRGLLNCDFYLTIGIYTRICQLCWLTIYSINLIEKVKNGQRSRAFIVFPIKLAGTLLCVTHNLRPIILPHFLFLTHPHCRKVTLCHFMYFGFNSFWKKSLSCHIEFLRMDWQNLTYILSNHTLHSPYHCPWSDSIHFGFSFLRLEMSYSNWHESQKWDDIYVHLLFVSLLSDSYTSVVDTGATYFKSIQYFTEGNYFQNRC